MDEAFSNVTRKLEAFEDINLEALRASVRALHAAFLDSGQYALLRIANNLNKELRKLECAK